MIGDPRFRGGRDAKRSLKLAITVKAEVERLLLFSDASRDGTVAEPDPTRRWTPVVH